MGVEVRSKLGNSVSRSLSGSSLIGDGMLVRLRSSTLAILGFVAAVGLGMVAVASQQGWPDVLTGPLPQAPSADFARNDPIVAPAPTFGPPPLFGRGVASSPDRPDRQPVDSNAVAASNLTTARQVATAPAEPAPAEPTAEPVPVAQEPAPTAPAPTPSTTQTTAGVGSATGGGPVTAGAGQRPAESDHGQGGQDESGPPSWADNNDDHDHGWDDDRRDDNDRGDWSSNDQWDDDNDDDRGDDGNGHGRDDSDRGGWDRH